MLSAVVIAGPISISLYLLYNQLEMTNLRRNIFLLIAFCLCSHAAVLHAQTTGVKVDVQIKMDIHR